MSKPDTGFVNEMITCKICGNTKFTFIDHDNYCAYKCTKCKNKIIVEHCSKHNRR